jgi:23S rRNA pseudouridine1911/1915/1917 synthase
MELPILYEDSDVVVINKPAGLITHSDGRTEEPSVADWVRTQYPDTSDVGEPWTSPQGEVILRPGIVHRLDRDTSGVLILAKTQEAYEFLKQQFCAWAP